MKCDHRLGFKDALVLVEMVASRKRPQKSAETLKVPPLLQHLAHARNLLLGKPERRQHWHDVWSVSWIPTAKPLSVLWCYEGSGMVDSFCLSSFNWCDEVVVRDFCAGHCVWRRPLREPWSFGCLFKTVCSLSSHVALKEQCAYADWLSICPIPSSSVERTLLRFPPTGTRWSETGSPVSSSTWGRRAPRY